MTLGDESEVDDVSLLDTGDLRRIESVGVVLSNSDVELGSRRSNHKGGDGSNDGCETHYSCLLLSLKCGKGLSKDGNECKLGLVVS